MRLALIGLVTALIVVVGARAVTPAASKPDPRWPGGVVNVYAPTQGTIDAMIIAASRWNYSGAKVTINVVRYAKDADVIVRRDDRRLRTLCGTQCFGFTTVVGRPQDGATSELLMRESLKDARPLTVWVAVHELGHVLGLRHRAHAGCTVMSAHWYDTRCAPSMAWTVASVTDPRCAPAAIDVDAAGRLYGGSASSRDPYCSPA